MMRHCSARPIRGRSSSSGSAHSRALWWAAGLLSLLAAAAPAQDIAGLSRAYRMKPSDANRAALAKAATAPLGKFALAAGDLFAGRYEQAAALDATLPPLNDYVAYIRARALAELEQPGAALSEAERVLAAKPASPFGREVSILAARERMEMGEAARAVAQFRRLPETALNAEAMFTFAQALEASGDLPGAATAFERVYYQFPLHARAAEAEGAIARLRTQLSGSFPLPTADQVARRATLLADGGSGRRAVEELRTAKPAFTSAAREMLEIREAYAIGSYDRRAAVAFLQSLSLRRGDADAERLERLVLESHRLKEDAAALAAMRLLDENYPVSPWRLEAGLYLGDIYLTTNDSAHYLPLYRSCYEANPKDVRASYCHWKVAWRNYLDDRSTGEMWFRDHLTRFPASDQAPAALYFLGRLAEETAGAASARAYFAAVVERTPGHYYSTLARERLEKLPKTNPSSAVVQWIAAHPSRPPVLPDFTADTPTEQRLARARLLAAAGLDNWAEIEFRFGAQNDAKPALLAMEWAKLATQRGDPHVGIRSIKAISSGYVNWDLDAAPEEFWKYAYPVPFADDVTGSASTSKVDWQVFAGLIRQESEFDPNALSRSHAMGLTQIMPATGRQVSAQLGIKPFKTSMLNDPSTSLQMGAHYLGQLFTSLDSRWEHTLASYNAGKTRVKTWLNWGDFREPAEFVETIPFRETRNYVKSVLRNADMYRRLYAPTLIPPALASPALGKPALGKPALVHPKPVAIPSSGGKPQNRQSGAPRRPARRSTRSKAKVSK